MWYFKTVVVFCAVIFLFAGCVSFEYTGEKAPQTSDVAVFTDSARIGRTYKVLGRAVVSGNYDDVSKEKMLDVLINKAKKSGADAVLIVEQQVIPSGEVSRPLFDTAFDFDNTNQSWRRNDKDVDLIYGEVGRKQPQNIRTVTTYKRIIRAEFLKYNTVSEKK